MRQCSVSWMVITHALFRLPVGSGWWHEAQGDVSGEEVASQRATGSQHGPGVTDRLYLRKRAREKTEAEECSRLKPHMHSAATTRDDDCAPRGVCWWLWLAGWPQIWTARRCLLERGCSAWESRVGRARTSGWALVGRVRRNGAHDEPRLSGRCRECERAR